MKTLVSNSLVAMMILPLIGSCGKSGTGDGKSGLQDTDQTTEQEREIQGTPDGSTIDGVYQAKFLTLNGQINGNVPGSLTVKREGDHLITYVRMFAGKPAAWHQQAIYMGTRCPTLSDDTNGDTFIDINEALAVIGKQIVPLDSNMNSQAAGKNIYPLADVSGYYHYERESSFSKMFADLKDVDKNPADHVAKLGLDENFTILGKVVLVQGVSETDLLPPTVGTMDRRRNFQTFPVTCGIIGKVIVDPGVFESEDAGIPGPVAEVMEGQDQPAPAPSEDPTTTGGQGGTVAGTTGTNDNGEGNEGDAGGDGDGSTTGGTTTGGGATIGGSVTTGGTTTGGGATIGGSVTTGGTTTGGGATIGGSVTTGGTTTGGTTTGRTDNDDEDDNNTTTGGSTSGGATTGSSTNGRNGGGFIGGFIGGSRNGSGGRSSGGRSGGRRSGGFIGGFIGGSETGTP